MILLFSLIWDTFSAWWLLVCLAVGFGYAWLLYRGENHLNRRFRYLMGAIRVIAVTMIAIMLLSPLIKSTTRHPQKPLVLIAQDNSASVALFNPKGENLLKTVKELGELKKLLGDRFDVRSYHFDKKLGEGLKTSFDGKQTDITAALKDLNERFINQNVGAVVLASDGIFNTGTSPQNVLRDIKAPIYTVALGDTIPRRDLVIGNVNYNKTVFLDNDFEVEVLVEAYQSKGETLHLKVHEDGRQINEQTIAVSSADFHQVVPLKLHAGKKGIRKFSFSLQEVTNERSRLNNIETVYIEVLDNKKKILLLYNAVHPDIAAIKAALKSESNLEVEAIAAADIEASKIGLYNLVILYQIPALGSPLSISIQNHLDKLRIPRWYIIGSQSDLTQFNRWQKLVAVSNSRQEIQDVFPAPKSGFSAFTLADSNLRTLDLLPPLTAPFGNFVNMGNQQDILLKQKVGQVVTNYPLITFGEMQGARIAILSAEGIWKWRLAEFSLKGNSNAVDELLGQSVQYLTAKGDRSRFKVYTAKNVFDESEEILFGGELYNETLEPVNGPDVHVELKGKSGKAYSYMMTRHGQGYQMSAGALPADEYTYRAETKLGTKSLTTEGYFTVKAIDIETRQGTADHHLLAGLANESGGKLILPNQLHQLAELIKKNEDIKTVVHTEESYGDLIDEKWLFAIIVLLLGIEWFLRKREGEI